MRWTNVSGASVAIGPLPSGTKRVALYLPTSPLGAPFTVELDGAQIHAGTTLAGEGTGAGAKNWVARTVLPVAGGRLLKVTVGAATATTQFSVSGATFFNTTGVGVDLSTGPVDATGGQA